MAKATLDTSRMTERQLHQRALSLTAQLSTYGFTSLKASDVRAMALELQRIHTELRLRGTQLTLAV